jgi:hypothetical protein
MTALELETTGPVGAVMLGQVRLRLVHSASPLANKVLAAGLAAACANRHARWLAARKDPGANLAGMAAGPLIDAWARLQNQLRDTDDHLAQIVDHTIWQGGVQS